jgi:predicted HicB family RNase H-like nuclease
MGFRQGVFLWPHSVYTISSTAVREMDMARRPPKPAAGARRRENVEMKLRLPQRLRQRLEFAASRNEQSLNSEMVLRLLGSFRADTFQRTEMVAKTAEFLRGGGLADPAVFEKMNQILVNEFYGANRPPARRSTDIAQMKLRIPGEVRLRLEREAARNDHSMNREIVQRLGWSFQEDAYRRGDIAAQTAEMIVRGLDEAVIERLKEHFEELV